MAHYRRVWHNWLPEMYARHVPHSLFFRTGLRWLSELLACEPTIEAYLAARQAQPYEAWVRRLFEQSNISILLCDYYRQGADSYSHDEFQALLARRSLGALGLGLKELVSEDFLSGDEAWQVAEAILGENARGLYGL